MAESKQQRDLRKLCQQLADQLGCEIERERGDGPDACYTWWVYGPRWLYGEHGSDYGERDDPLTGNHACCSWEEVEIALRDYEADMLASGLPKEPVILQFPNME